MGMLTPKFTEQQLIDDPILRYFQCDHLPDHLVPVSKPFAALALGIVTTIPRNPERKVALRKLLEAKDCAVRANLPPVPEYKERVGTTGPIDEPVEIMNADIDVDGPPKFG